MTALCICGHEESEHVDGLKCSRLESGTWFCPCVTFRLSSLSLEDARNITKEQRARLAERLYEETVEQTLRLFHMPSFMARENRVRQDRELLTRRERVI